MNRYLPNFFIFFCFLIPVFKAQQNYSGNSVMDCDKSDDIGPSSAFLYTCNGQARSCRSFLIFKSQPPYNSVSTISNLTSADPTELARINNLSTSAVLAPQREVIVPVKCSCAGQYYQANTSFIIPTIYDTYFTIANYTYQGLSTCNILLRENKYGATDLSPGLVLKVPLRCACPTSNQTVRGIKFLLTYLISWGDTVPDVSKRFNASIDAVTYANAFADDNPTVYPFTTILLPLSAEPSSSQTITHYTPPPDSVNGNRNRRPGKYVWIGFGLFLLFLCIVLLMLFLHHKKLRSWCGKKEADGENKWELPEDFRADISQRLKVYRFEELVVASENFSSRNWLDGSVFRGVFRGEVMAIKRVSKDVSKEVNFLSRINHFNLIHLYGACEHLAEFYLVFEFMENGSLQQWLRKKGCPEVQNWNYRIQIALDIANGLHYLHNFTYPAYVHKDINTGNVLLNRELRAKIANFSLARSADWEESKILSMQSAVVSKGYEAPEYMEYGLVTTETDIYAFGIVLLELSTGKEAVFTQEGKEVTLSEEILLLMERENAEDELSCFIDPSLQVEHRMELVLRMVKLSLACLADEPERRLRMAEVVASLLKIQMDAQKTEPYFWNGSLV